MIRRWIKKVGLSKALIVCLMMFIFSSNLDTAEGGERIFPLIRFLEPSLYAFTLLIVLIALAIYTLRKRPNVDTAKIIKSLLGGEIGSLFGIVSFVWTLVLVGWITDYLREGRLLMALITFELFLILFTLFILLVDLPEYESKSSKPEKKKVLIFGLSKPNKDKSAKALKEVLEDLYHKHHPLRHKFNWEVPARSIIYHLEKLEEIHVITSKESRFEEFKKGLRRFLCSIDKNIATYEYGPVEDFDSYDEIFQRIEDALIRIRRKGYDDNDISFNISGGTSAVSAAIIISAIKEGRQVEYLSQEPKNNKELRRIDVSEIQVLRVLGRIVS